MEKDLDRIVDEMVSSQEVVERAERNIPDYVEKHKFYQDLRGYVTDMVDCYNEKVIHHPKDKFFNIHLKQLIEPEENVAFFLII